MAVEASVIIDFEGTSADEVSGTILVELDDEHPNNLNADGELKSSFSPDDTPVFLVHHDNTIEITDIRCTDGTLDSLGTNVRRTREVNAVFTRVDTEVSLSYYGVTSVVTEWFGNVGVTHVNGMNWIANNGVFPCYCEGEISVLFNLQYQLTPPPLTLAGDETYTIYVVVYAREIIIT